MTVRWKPRNSIKGYLPWAALFAVPLIVNGLLWAALVRPPQQQLHQWRDTEALTELKPRLESLLTESHRMLMDWERTAFTNDDPAAVTQAIEQLVGRHHVQRAEINTKSNEATGLHSAHGMTAMSLTVGVKGRFSKLAHWMSDVEAQSGLQVDSWELSAGEKPGDLHTLTVNLTAFLRGA